MRQPGARRGFLQPRNDEPDRVVARRDDEHREPLERQCLVPGQVAEVGPDSHEERVEARVRRCPGGAIEALAVAGRRDRRSRGDGHRRTSVRSGSAPEPRRERLLAVLEQLPVGVDPLGARGECASAQLRVVVLADGENPAAGVGGLPDGHDSVVGAGREVDDHRVGRRQRLVERGEGPDGGRVGAGRLDLGDEAGRPDQVVGEDEDAHARMLGVSRASSRGGGRRRAP